MTKKTLNGRSIYKGKAEGQCIVTNMGISFFGGVDPDTGIVVENGHELEGENISGRILVFPTAPLAIINAECETITAVGCIISEIPCVDLIHIDQLKTGMLIAVDGESGTVEIIS